MSKKIRREIEVSVSSALLKSAAIARDLVKARFRPNLLPSPAGLDPTRLILRARDARGEVTEAAEERISEVGPVVSKAARQLQPARRPARPQREQTLGSIAALELSQTSESLSVTGAKVEELIGQSPTPLMQQPRVARGKLSPLSFAAFTCRPPLSPPQARRDTHLLA